MYICFFKLNKIIIIIILILLLLLFKTHGSVSRVMSAVVVMFCFSHPYDKSINAVPVSFLIISFILRSYFDGSKMTRICCLALFSDGI